MDASRKSGSVATAINKLRGLFNEKLFDYNSARFKSVRLYYSTLHSPVIACGEVNSKNTLGGYTGWKPFIYIGDNNELEIEHDEPTDPEGTVVFDFLKTTMCSRHHYEHLPTPDGCDYAPALFYARAAVRAKDCPSVFELETTEHNETIARSDVDSLEHHWYNVADACANHSDPRYHIYCGWKLDTETALKLHDVCRISKDIPWASCNVLTDADKIVRKITAPSDVRNLLKEYVVEDELCRGGAGDDPETNAACDHREEFDQKLLKVGWCFGQQSQYGYQTHWAPCAFVHGQ